MFDLLCYDCVASLTQEINKLKKVRVVEISWKYSVLNIKLKTTIVTFSLSK